MTEQGTRRGEGQKYYLTTPIYYPNDNLHIGHCYTTVAADVLARYKRLMGYDVLFLTGMDEHGQKIQREAESRGMKPQEFVDHMAEGIRKLWKMMDISYDRFARTTDPEHVERVQKIFLKLKENGDIYKGSYEGWYCTPCESFWTETQVGEEHLCPDCHRPVELTKEESYFFRLSKYQDRLIQYYKDHPDFAEPASRRNEMIKNFLEPGLEDLAVSRTSFNWGVPVPGDEDHVIYVWIDALSNYITFLGYPDDPQDFEHYWPADIHLMAKEIFRFHSIIWPAILMSLDLPMPKKIFGHGWLLFGGERMSKSKGNVVDPVILCERYGVDPIRFFLMRDVVFGSDGDFSTPQLIERTNIDLANDLGNLLSRTTAMFAKYFDGTFPEAREAQPIDQELEEVLAQSIRDYHKHIDNYAFQLALESIWVLIRRSNKYIDETMPWVLGKDPAQAPRLASVLEHLLEVLRHVALALAPFMPSTTKRMLEALKLDSDDESIATMFAELGTFAPRASLAPIEPVEPLFPRLDLEKELEALEALKQNATAAAGGAADVETSDAGAVSAEGEGAAEDAGAIRHKEPIEFETFESLELRVAKVQSCERVEKADRLLKLILDLGHGETRQVVSGIAKFYEPEDLVGKEVVYLANLKPIKLRGVLSEGMVLCAEDAEGKVIILRPDEVAGAGAEIS